MKTNTEQLKNYLSDIKITKGLYVTTNLEKIIRNCKDFEINIPNNLSNISNRNRISILTLRISDYEFIQFIIKWNLNSKELLKLDNDFISTEIKLMILEAFKLTKTKTFKYLL